MAEWEGGAGLLNEIRASLETLGNEEQARFLQKYFKTGPGQYGEGDLFRVIRVPALRAVARGGCRLPLGQALELLRSPYHEDRLVALLILVGKYGKADPAGQTEIFSLYLANTRFINNWDLVDVSAEHIVGAYLFTRDRVLLRDLAGSRSLWERRIAILSTFHFIRRFDFHDTLHIAEVLLGDREDLIQKGTGWMLREVGKRDLALLEHFLAAHCRVMPRTMLRYAIERLPTEKRMAYMKGLV